MIPGINYPWTVFEGRANYGCDFGTNIWNSHTGVSAHVAEVRADLEAMAAIGLEVTRWFVFTDGRGGVAWAADGELTGLASGFFADMDAALECAAAARLRLCFVLLDFSWADDPSRRKWLSTDEGVAVLVERLIDPILERYGPAGERASLGHAIHSFDVINEPDWVTRSLASDSRREALSLEQLRAFIGAVARRIHARSDALVTVGGARVRFVREWAHPDIELDFLQVHSYPDVRYPERDETVFGRSADSFGLAKPLLIGEHPSNPRVHPAGHLSPAYSLEDYLTLARDGGYLGAWPWSFKGVDGFGAVDHAVMRAWILS